MAIETHKGSSRERQRLIAINRERTQAVLYASCLERGKVMPEDMRIWEHSGFSKNNETQETI